MHGDLTGVTSSAFETRLRNFGRRIHFHAPGLKRYATEEFQQAAPERFTALSLTAGRCSLQCDHCKSSVLLSMRAVPRGASLFEFAQGLAAAGTRGLLVSGGMTVDGRVPHREHLESLARVRRELGQKLFLHTGLVDIETARAMKRAGVDGALIDIVGSDQTIHEVYHLKKKRVADFAASLAALCEAGLTVMPHIVLGLHYGRMLGEENALEIVARYPVAALVLVVLTPILATAMQDVEPPAPEEVGRFFERARLKLPAAPIYLGCARPGGAHRQATDRLAIDMGLNGIAYPGQGVVAYARSRNLQPAFHEACCSIHEL